MGINPTILGSWACWHLCIRQVLLPNTEIKNRTGDVIKRVSMAPLPSGSSWHMALLLALLLLNLQVEELEEEAVAG